MAFERIVRNHFEPVTETVNDGEKTGLRLFELANGNALEVVSASRSYFHFGY